MVYAFTYIDFFLLKLGFLWFANFLISLGFTSNVFFCVFNLADPCCYALWWCVQAAKEGQRHAT